MEVSIGAGLLRGTTICHSGGGEVSAFLGIPYAAAPLAALRWRPPQPVSSWTGFRDATRFGDDFPQAGNALFRAPAQSEDCLYLNVWAPANAQGAELPVMVWLHGGGFVGGSGSDARCDGAAFAAAGVVVVSLNYRSGIFGFLAHPGLSRESEQGASGNYGLLDQIAALRWVQENIAAFGGSPRRVTVFGVSAGSAAIALLMTTSQARGLFSQAILHSPGSCRPLASLDDAQTAALVLGADIAAMRQWSATELFAKTPLMVPKMRGLTTPRVLRPIRDGWLITQDELPALDRGEFAAMPLLVGSNADEGSKLTAGWTVDTVEQYRALLETSFGAMAAQAFDSYPASADAQVRGRVGEIFGDTQFNYGTWRLAEAMAAKGEPTYRYLFSRRRPGQRDGPHHGDEVSYVFDNLVLHDQRARFEFNETDQSVARAMHGAWLRFARDGDPNGAGLPSWPRFARERGAALVFDESITVNDSWRSRQLAFIDSYARFKTKS